ncbi:hypothetical protein K0M31_013334 [Melipona bicolor]|uniref:Uncharacterized protein n=1 Tax=Melipona bicolor TaxID=60889 RepID=A0AA40FI51_9HYME|nr:hypothetical protein K0M31_013334 [Melipona bicolor]
MDAERAVPSNCGRSNLEARLRQWSGDSIEDRREEKGEAYEEEIGGKILVDWRVVFQTWTLAAAPRGDTESPRWDPSRRLAKISSPLPA